MIQVHWKEDSDATVLGRLTARNPSAGAVTGVAGEGRWLQQADISSITCAVYDLSSDTPGAAITTPAVEVSTAILDTAVTVNEIWTVDSVGYNFIHDLAAVNFPTGGHKYMVEYTVTLSGGAKFHEGFIGPASGVKAS